MLARGWKPSWRGSPSRADDPGRDGALDRGRYPFLTSRVVLRTIAWISTGPAARVRNLAPFSYFTAVSATPLLVPIGRRGAPKDTLRDIRETGVFCVTVVTGTHLTEMNETSDEHGPEAGEVERAGVREESVDMPSVAECPPCWNAGCSGRWSSKAPYIRSLWERCCGCGSRTRFR